MLVENMRVNKFVLSQVFCAGFCEGQNFSIIIWNKYATHLSLEISSSQKSNNNADFSYTVGEVGCVEVCSCSPFSNIVLINFVQSSEFVDFLLIECFGGFHWFFPRLNIICAILVFSVRENVDLNSCPVKALLVKVFFSYVADIKIFFYLKCCRFSILTLGSSNRLGRKFSASQREVLEVDLLRINQGVVTVYDGHLKISLTDLDLILPCFSTLSMLFRCNVLNPVFKDFFLFKTLCFKCCYGVCYSKINYQYVLVEVLGICIIMFRDTGKSGVGTIRPISISIKICGYLMVNKVCTLVSYQITASRQHRMVCCRSGRLIGNSSYRGSVALVAYFSKCSYTIGSDSYYRLCGGRSENRLFNTLSQLSSAIVVLDEPPIIEFFATRNNLMMNDVESTDVKIYPSRSGVGSFQNFEMRGKKLWLHFALPRLIERLDNCSPCTGSLLQSIPNQLLGQLSHCFFWHFFEAFEQRSFFLSRNILITDYFSFNEVADCIGVELEGHGAEDGRQPPSSSRKSIPLTVISPLIEIASTGC